MLRIVASGYGRHQKDGRGHHLVIFSTPSAVIDTGESFKNVEFKCSLPTWTPTHGSIKDWDPISLEDSRTGLLIPRFWWDVFFRWIPKKRKVRMFSMQPKNPST